MLLFTLLMYVNFGVKKKSEETELVYRISLEFLSQRRRKWSRSLETLLETARLQNNEAGKDELKLD